MTHPKNGSIVAADGEASQAPRGCIRWLLGPVGSGKSTLAARLADRHEAQHHDLDAWMGLFRPDRPEEGLMEWYRERAARCVGMIRLLALRDVELGRDVVLELGLVRRAEREAFLADLKRAGLDVEAELEVHVVDAPREVRRERVRRRNHERGATFSMVVPDAIFELASSSWEPVADELTGVRVVRHET